MINDDDAFAVTLRGLLLRLVYGHYEPVRRVQRTELATGGPRERHANRLGWRTRSRRLV